jgi:HAD superfamily hydrolase (TIGR01549 family)
MNVQGIIFDMGHTLMLLDGTWPQMFERGVSDLAAFLHDQVPDLDGETFAQALLDRRADAFAHAKETLREITAEDSMRWTFAHFGLPEPDPALVHGAINAFFAYEAASWLAFPEALTVLSELAGRGLRLGLFSNATYDSFIQRLVDRFGFRPWLDPALSSAGVGIRKPDPAALTPFLDAWGLLPDSVVMVGDTLDADILGAQRAGMASVWLRSREDARQEGDGHPHLAQGEQAVPTATIQHLADLPRCLEQLGKGNPHER